LLDIVPITADPTSNPNDPVNVQVVAGPNGWSWNSSVAGSIQVAQASLYGNLNEQFAELQQLWSTYRLISVNLTYVPSMQGAGN
jgi:hypothetical protein